MSVVIRKLANLSTTLENKLKTVGIRDSDDLLRACKSAGAIEHLAASVGVEAREITHLVHRAELARIRGIGDAYAQLLEAAGVRTVGELATRCPEDLRDQFSRINDEQKLVGRVPALAMVNGWVTKAQRLHKPSE
ncbi:MAG: DNA polymerase IV [Chloroflexi bacterium ADurb.Bin325]|nr:MAG: DNA polymerase IV [Chloroflexi bacterium ADurb.Bin325]